MIRVEEADSLIRRHLPRYPTETVPLDQAHGRVLREDLYADRDLPPFNRATMDGIAIAGAARDRDTREFRIEATIHAGEQPPSLSNPETGCVLIMTGAALPPACDCVIPIEELTIRDGCARREPGTDVQAFQHVHRQGSDRMAGDRIWPAGSRLNAVHMALAASIGRSRLQTAKYPRLAVITTGNEIVAVDRKAGPFQIRSSNDQAIRTALLRSGFPDSGRYHIRDDRQETESVLKEALKAHDGIILTGGVSMGQQDFVPDSLESLGVRCIFHKVRQRPGKPFWFGVTPDHKPVFALPGNPVSTLVCLHRFVVPHLEAALGVHPPRPVFAVLEEDVVFTSPLTYHVPVKIESRSDGRICAWPVPTHTSGDLASLQQSQGFVELPPAESIAPRGTTAPYFRWI